MSFNLTEGVLPSMLNGVDIPACPTILCQLETELNREDPDLRELTRLIGKDVALAGHAMAIANSPAYSVSCPVTSLLHAINVLGTMHLISLVVTHLLKTALSSNAGLAMERFWESSALTARVSAELARRLHCVRSDIAYTFGLFHDCGIPLIMKRFPQTRLVLAEANETEERVFTDIEEMRLGTNHAIVGYYLARHWRLPDFIIEGILHHHDYSVLLQRGRVSDTARSLIGICALAEHISRVHKMGYGENEWLKAAPAVCELFDISLGAVDDLIEDMLDWLR